MSPAHDRDLWPLKTLSESIVHCVIGQLCPEEYIWLGGTQEYFKGEFAGGNKENRSIGHLIEFASRSSSKDINRVDLQDFKHMRST